MFGIEEYRHRVGALQAGMAEAGLSALWLTMPADIFYVTGFLTRFWESPARPWHVIVPANGDPVAVIPDIGAPLMRQGAPVEIRTWPAPRVEDDGVSLLAETLAELVAPAGRIGVPMGPETHMRMPLSDHGRILDLVAPRRVADATQVLRRVREVKSEAEIARIRAACAVADRAFARVPELAAPGVPLDRVFRDFQRLLLEKGADWVAYLAGGAGPGGYGDVISPATARPLATGDVLMLDTGAVRGGYFCDFDRNFSVGPVSDQVRQGQEALHAATEEALSSIRPGMRACDVHAILATELTRRGAVPLGGRLGHGLGLTLTEWPSLAPDDRTALREGMVLTLEPGVELAPGRILVHEEVIALRGTGAELLSARAPRDMVEL